MAMANPYARVLDNAIMTASKEELTLMLYEGALKFGNQSLAAIEKKDPERANHLILRVQDIIRELQVTLDRQYEISAYFDALYDYMYRRLVEANMSKDAAIVSEVLGLVREFRDTWKEAMRIAKNSA